MLNIVVLAVFLSPTVLPINGLNSSVGSKDSVTTIYAPPNSEIGDRLTTNHSLPAIDYSTDNDFLQPRFENTTEWCNTFKNNCIRSIFSWSNLRFRLFAIAFATMIVVMVASFGCWGFFLDADANMNAFMNQMQISTAQRQQSAQRQFKNTNNNNSQSLESLPPNYEEACAMHTDLNSVPNCVTEPLPPSINSD